MTDIAEALDSEALHDLVLKELERDAIETVESIMASFVDNSPLQLLEMENQFALLAALNVVIRFYGGFGIELPSYRKLGDRLAKLRESKP